MKNNTTNDKIIGLRNCYFLFFSIFSLLHITVVFIDNDIHFKIPVILYFFISFSLLILFLYSGFKSINNNIVYLFNLSFCYIIFSFFSVIISQIIISAKSLYDINFVLSIIAIFFLMLGMSLGKYFINRRDFREIPKTIQIRANVIEVKSINFWSELSLDKAPWLGLLLRKVKYGVTFVVIFVGGSASGISLAIAEGLKRSELLDPAIDTHAFLFFTLGVPVGLISGVVLYPLLSYLFRWRKLTMQIKREYGSYTLLLNLDNKPYSQLKSEIENDH